MKKVLPFLSLIILCLVLSYCHSKKNPEKNLSNQFFLEDSVSVTNTYTPTGLLDSSYSLAHHYFKDSLIMIIRSYTIRKYNEMNLLAQEQEFDKDEEGNEYTLANQTIYEYDKKRRLVKETNLLGKIVFSVHALVYNDFDSVSKEIYIVQNVPDDNSSNMMADMMHHSGYITYDTMAKTYLYDANRKLITNTNKSISKTSMDIGDDEKLIIKIHDTKKDYYIDSSWTKSNILVRQVYLEEYPSCTCKTCTYYNKKGDEIRMLKYRLMKD